MTKLDRKTWRFTPNAGTVESPVYCGVCGQKCEETRDINGPRSYVENMAEVSSLYDEFVCPNGELEWHQQAVDISVEADKTSSNRLRKLLLDEADDIVANELYKLHKIDPEVIYPPPHHPFVPYVRSREKTR